MNVTVKLPNTRSGDSHGQERFLAPSSEKQTRNYDIQFSNHHPFISTLRPRVFAVARLNGEEYIQIYQLMSQSDYRILGAEIARARKQF